MRTRHHGRSAARSLETDALTKYLTDIGRYAVLSRADEAAIARRIRDGDREALDQLVCANLRFVVLVAKQYQHRGLALPDLIEEGNLGLVRAAERFDERRGVKFISYAVWWIRQSILQALADHGHIVRVPIAKAGAMRRVGYHASQLSHDLGREPTNRELAVALGMTEADVIAALPVARASLSLNAPAGESEGQLLDVLADADATAADVAVADASLVEPLEAALRLLRGRERAVLTDYFGLDGKETKTLEEIGAQYGITRERVRQIKDKGLFRIRRSPFAQVLEAFR